MKDYLLPGWRTTTFDNFKSCYQELTSIQATLAAALNLPAMVQELTWLQKIVEGPHTSEQQTHLVTYAHISNTVESFNHVTQCLQNALTGFELGEEIFYEDIQAAFVEAVESLLVLQKGALLFGEHDTKAAVVTVRAGSGGADAADFALMLTRMYLRYFQNRYRVTVQEWVQEDRFRQATLLVDGDHPYGYLNGEKGTHRLVRTSPYDSAGRRHTAFAQVEVVPYLPVAKVEYDSKDLRFDVYRSSGPGGQSVNTTDSAVRVTHLPTGVTASCQNEKSQSLNRAQALQVLHSRLTLLQEEQNNAFLSSFKSGVAAWGTQVRSYVFNPQKYVKDHRANVTFTNVDTILAGDIGELLQLGLQTRAIHSNNNV